LNISKTGFNSFQEYENQRDRVLRKFQSFYYKYKIELEIINEKNLNDDFELALSNLVYNENFVFYSSNDSSLISSLNSGSCYEQAELCIETAQETGSINYAVSAAAGIFG
jgi:hypothetical protein